MRGLGYLVAAYLLASWGVNGVVNPVHYIRCARMQIQMLEVSERGDGIVLRLPEGYGEKGLGVLSFRVTESEDYSFNLRLLGYPSDGDAQEADIKVWKGWNTVELDRLQSGKSWKEILVPKDVSEAEGLVLEDAGLSKWRKVDVGRAVYIFAAFLFLAVFWECVWWIKERYAE